MVDVRDPLYKPHFTTMWQDHVKKGDSSGTSMAKADDAIQSLQLSQNKIQFEADSLSLARDASVLASLYKQQMRSDRSNRLAKVMHIKQQNAIGSGLVMQHLEKNAKHLAGPIGNLSAELDKVGV